MAIAFSEDELQTTLPTHSLIMGQEWHPNSVMTDYSTINPLAKQKEQN